MKRLVLFLLMLHIVYVHSETVHVGDYVFPEDFARAMISDSQDKELYKKFIKNTPHKKLFALIKRTYTKFIGLVDQELPNQQRIPNIIHQIWVGPHPFPEKALTWQQTWQQLHPEWEYKLWTNEDVEQLEFANKKYYNQAKNWGEKADILRYEILYRFGGLYVDIDFEALKPFDMLHQLCDFYTGIHAVPLLFKQRLRINNGLIAACPGHPILRRAVEQIPYYRDKSDVAKRTGPDFFTTIIGDVLYDSLAAGYTDIVFPSNYFYPSGKRQGFGFSLQPDHIFIQPETLGIHYYTAYWLRPHQNTQKRRRLSLRVRRYPGRISQRHKKSAEHE